MYRDSTEHLDTVKTHDKETHDGEESSKSQLVGSEVGVDVRDVKVDRDVLRFYQLVICID